MIKIKAGSMIRTASENDFREAFVLIATEKVEEIEADGDELRDIVERIGGIPYPKDWTIQVFAWHGDFAKTIFSNLEMIF